MLTKNKIKLYTLLQQKKYRNLHRLFIAEGLKLVKDIVNSNFEIEAVLYSDLIDDELHKSLLLKKTDVFQTDYNTIKKISSLKTPQPVLAIVYIPDKRPIENEIENDLTIVLDNIQDPGNLGTIIRIADWYGIKNIVCSEGSVDTYNPKTVQASMGSIARVNIFYEKLEEFLMKTTKPLYGTFLDGQDILNIDLSSTGYIIFGNESAGIGSEVEKLITNRIYIPCYPNESKPINSLNISVAAGIVCNEFRRRNYSK